jgi:hypothetical protein
MAFTVTWVRGGVPEVFDERFEYEIVGGVLNISGADGRLMEQFAPNAWFSVVPFAVEQQAIEQPPFGRLAAGPGLNWRAARQQGYLAPE